MAKGKAPRRARRVARPKGQASRSPASSQEAEDTSRQEPAHGDAAENEGLFFREAMNVMLPRVISSVNETIAFIKKRPFVTLLLVFSAGACCMSFQRRQKPCTKDVTQVPPELAKLRSIFAQWKEQYEEMQLLRDAVEGLAEEISVMKKDAQQIREEMSATTGVSSWVPNTAGTAINLQRSSSSSTWICRTFWFHCAPPLLDTFVQPDESPGHCWPFQSSRSEVLLRLPTKMQPKAVTIQPAPKPASSLETISSIPRDFTVSGLDEEGKEEILLRTFMYAAWKKPNKTFPLQNGSRKAFRVLKLVIWSSWGTAGYTCIYRVEVQGKIVETNAISLVPALSRNKGG